MILGINSLNHDASIALINNNDILFAAHAERYSRIKNDKKLNKDIVSEALTYGTPEKIVWFEKPWAKGLRKLYSGERPWLENPKQELKRLGLGNIPLETVWHHEAHAAAGYFTSPFEEAAILVIDAIGEWDTLSIWHGKGSKLTKKFSIKYPDSIGLFYTAFTDWAGLKPNEEEYIFMGMAAYGKPLLYEDIKKEFFCEWKPPYFQLTKNLHRGIKDWQMPKGVTAYDVAASVQKIAQEFILETVTYIKETVDSNNLVYMGGVALNCVANTLIADSKLFKDIWIMPNPGDSGSAIGSVAAYTNQQLHWTSPFLGTNIGIEYDPRQAVKELLKNGIAGLATGRAEFGPRAFGNRSLIADPRTFVNKEKVNTIKQRQQFRPFAPAILEEHAHDYFNMSVKNSPYMQYTFLCKKPTEIPAVVHFDNTSRVQTVAKGTGHFRELLEVWYKETGCPVLLNTSLNIKGEPLVNTIDDAIRWSSKYNVKLF